MMYYREALKLQAFLDVAENEGLYFNLENDFSHLMFTEILMLYILFK